MVGPVKKTGGVQGKDVSAQNVFPEEKKGPETALVGGRLKTGNV